MVDIISLPMGTSLLIYYSIDHNSGMSMEFGFSDIRLIHSGIE